jgi:hypothetical protein
MYILASGYINLQFSKFLGIVQLTFEATGKILLNKNAAMVLFHKNFAMVHLTDVKQTVPTH